MTQRKLTCKGKKVCSSFGSKEASHNTSCKSSINYCLPNLANHYVCINLRESLGIAIHLYRYWTEGAHHLAITLIPQLPTGHNLLSFHLNVYQRRVSEGQHILWKAQTVRDMKVLLFLTAADFRGLTNRVERRGGGCCYSGSTFIGFDVISSHLIYSCPSLCLCSWTAQRKKKNRKVEIWKVL